MGRSRNQRNSQRIGSPEERPSSTRLLLTAVLVLLPTVLVGYLMFAPTVLTSPVITEINDTGWKIVRHAEATGSWPTSLEGLWGPGESPPAGATLSWDPDTLILTAELDPPLETRSFLHLLTFGAFGRIYENERVNLRLDQRSSIPARAPVE